jgi:hypothetical protein
MTEIPIDPTLASQTFKTDLEGNTYNFRVYYNSRGGYYAMDLSNENDELLVGGITLVMGGDIINQHELNIGGMFVVESGDTAIDPVFGELGSTHFLVHLTEQELADGITV